MNEKNIKKNLPSKKTNMHLVSKNIYIYSFFVITSWPKEGMKKLRKKKENQTQHLKKKNTYKLGECGWRSKVWA